MFNLTFPLLFSIFLRFLSSLGISYVTFQGMDSFLSYIMSYVQNLLLSSSIPSASLNIMGMLGLDKLINLIISAYSARLAMASLRKFRMLS